ncbi:MAG: hypothetical protein OXD46_09010 [Chloroflexi bacterium]|nr:hypothetical protein [Chloroflexota bacterium]
MHGNAFIRYSVSMTSDSRIPDRNAEDIALNGSVLFTVNMWRPDLRDRPNAGASRL